MRQVGWCVEIYSKEHKEWLLYELTHLKEKAESMLASLAMTQDTRVIRAVKLFVREEGNRQ